MSAASRLAILVSLLLGCSGRSGAVPSEAEPEGAGLRVLFIGNSLTRGNDLPLLVQALARAGGEEMFVESLTHGGFSLEDHWQKGDAQKAIAKRRWDVVVLQHGPSSLLSSRRELRGSTRKLAKKIRQAGGRPALYMVWPDLSRKAYFDDVRESYSLAASDVDGIFIPAGEAWRAAWRRDPRAPLYGRDRFHPSVAGSYAAALSIYGMLTGRDPRGLPHRLELRNGRTVEVPEKLAKLLQEAAAEANRTYGRR